MVKNDKIQSKGDAVINKLKKVAAIHDLSSYGRCSLSVISPILSVMGIQCLSLPTAVLSTHTGGFSGMAITDLTDFLYDTLKHWKTVGVSCDCVYTGFLASDKQINLVKEYIYAYENSFCVVDPVLGDNGVGYQTCTPALISKMKELIAKADLITPNLTELCMLSDTPYIQNLSVEKAKEYLIKLTGFGPKRAIVTGILIDGKSLANIAYDKISAQFYQSVSKQIPVHYPGTGDIYTSVLTANLLRDCENAKNDIPFEKFCKAINSATSFTHKCIELTYSQNTEPRQGVLLEGCLEYLAGRLSLHADSYLT